MSYTEYFRSVEPCDIDDDGKNRLPYELPNDCYDNILNRFFFPLSLTSIVSLQLKTCNISRKCLLFMSKQCIMYHRAF